MIFTSYISVIAQFNSKKNEIEKSSYIIQQ